jgi:hypothetical protein
MGMAASRAGVAGLRSEAGVGLWIGSGLFFVNAEIADCFKVPNLGPIATGVGVFSRNKQDATLRSQVF